MKLLGLPNVAKGLFRRSRTSLSAKNRLPQISVCLHGAIWCSVAFCRSLSAQSLAIPQIEKTSKPSNFDMRIHIVICCCAKQKFWNLKAAKLVGLILILFMSSTCINVAG